MRTTKRTTTTANAVEIVCTITKLSSNSKAAAAVPSPTLRLSLSLLSLSLTLRLSPCRTLPNGNLSCHLRHALSQAAAAPMTFKPFDLFIYFILFLFFYLFFYAGPRNELRAQQTARKRLRNRPDRDGSIEMRKRGCWSRLRGAINCRPNADLHASSSRPIYFILIALA